MQLNKVEEGIEAIRAGKIIIVVDDEHRENEGDFVCAAECVTSEMINFMATNGRGLICTPLDETLADALDLPLMVSSNTALHETAFTVSIDLIGQGCSTGISAYDRSTGIRAMVNPDTKASDFARPGHIFPLRAKSGGVLRRTGHTEATVDLARLAGFKSAGVLVEILNEDGTMARLPQLLDIAKKYDLKIISIDDLVEYRMRTERLIKRELQMETETAYGTFQLSAFKDLMTNDVHIAFHKGNWALDEPVLARIHSDNVQMDVLNVFSKKFTDDISASLKQIAENGKGVLLCMRHSDGKDVLLEKLLHLKTGETKKTDFIAQREFGVGAQIVREMGIRKLRLLTHNVERRIGLVGYGLEIVENVQI